MKAGTPTGFQDMNGAAIKVGDRIQHDDGTIVVIDKFGRTVSRFGIVTALDKVGTVRRGMNEDGTYFARIVDWKITDDPMPSRPEGETVKPGDDSQNMAPDRVREHVNTAPKSKKYRTKAIREAEAEAVANGITVDEARKVQALQDYQDEDLCDELRARGYHGEVIKTKTIKI